MGLRALIAEDYRAHGRDWTRPGFRTMAVYRFGVWRMGVRPKLLRAPLSVLYRAAFRYCRNVYGIELPYSATVGRGVVIEHQGGIVIPGWLNWFMIAVGVVFVVALLAERLRERERMGTSERGPWCQAYRSTNGRSPQGQRP